MKETYTVGPPVTVAQADDRGEMCCVFCFQSFGPALAFARRLELNDRWDDSYVRDQMNRIRQHVLQLHRDERVI